MDDIRFESAVKRITRQNRERAGIGTLGEKTLHAVLKIYMDADETHHEIRVDGYVADIVGAEGIMEIQTGNFNRLRKKLECFLEKSQVRVVYPIPRTKWLSWVDSETGEISNRRKSPKTGKPYEILSELYKIKSFLTHPDLKFTILMIDMEEYRNLDGWSPDKKKGSSRCERFPVGLEEVVEINEAADYSSLIPAGLPDEFTVKDYKKASGLSQKKAGTALHVLTYVGVVTRIGKIGNAYLYQSSSAASAR